MRLFTALRLLKLKAREYWLNAQVEDKQELIACHVASFDLLVKELRRVKQDIAMLTPAADLLAEFNAKKGA